ncbi:MAG: LysR substrate-binding domain-containing protein, partial [Gammaproteobacteria bacterium]
RDILHGYLTAWPQLDIEVTSRYRFDSFAAIGNYKLDAVLTSDPAFNGPLCYRPLFDFELVLLVAKQHRLARYQEIEPEELRQEVVFTYPVERDRLDIFRQVLYPAGIEPLEHKTVEETDVMLQMAASGRGVCLLPDWLLRRKSGTQTLHGLRFKGLALNKTMYLATRCEDAQLDYIRWLAEHAGKHSAMQSAR